YLFVRRELGHPFYGLVAISLFGVTSIYQQAVGWFSTSFSVLTLDMLLLGLLAAQRWRQTGRSWHLALCVLWCGLAPAWFASGVLAGPLCGLYLLVPQRSSPGKAPPSPRAPLRRCAVAPLPLAGRASRLFVWLSPPPPPGIRPSS